MITEIIAYIIWTMAIFFLGFWQGRKFEKKETKRKVTDYSNEIFGWNDYFDKSDDDDKEEDR